MNILYTSLAYKPSFEAGGPVISVSSQAEALVRRGHKVTVFTTDVKLKKDLGIVLNKPTDVNGVEVWYFETKEPLKQYLPFVPYISQSIGFLYCPAMLAELKKIMPSIDLVHTNMPFIYPTYAAAKVAAQFGKPLFYSQRGTLDKQRLKFRALKKMFYISFIEKPIMKSATTLIALTENERASYGSFSLKRPCAIIPNGIDVKSYRRSPLQDIDGKYGIPTGSKVVLFLGQLLPIKRVDRLLDAFFDVSRERQDVILLIAGPDVYGIEKKYRRSITALGLESRIKFLGPVMGELKLDLLARADLFCLPSDAEGFSIAVLEALASATPVLISPGCYFPDVEDAGVGRVVSNSVNSLRGGILALLAEPGTLDVMGKKAVEFVSSCYSWDHIVSDLADVYKEGLERFKSS